MNIIQGECNYLGIGELKEIAEVCEKLTRIVEDLSLNSSARLELFTEKFPESQVYDANGELLGTVALHDGGSYGFYPGLSSVWDAEQIDDGQLPLFNN